MSAHGKDELHEIAAAISDGTPVDWELEKTRTPAIRSALEHLAVLERIRDVHRGMPASDGETGVSPFDQTRTATAAPVTAIAPLFTWGTLRVLEKVAEGGAGEIYRALDPSLETEVALKLLRPEMSGSAAASENFIREARRLARVRHPNVLVVHGADRHEGRAGIWSEFIRGESLETLIGREGTMNAREATLVGLDLCRALSAMHAANLVHRDVKASNVMREKGGRTVLMDFGSVAELPSGGALARTNHIHGTLLSMAPEQLRGEVAGPATDVYGLGTLLYHLVTGTYPLDARSLEELVQGHRTRSYIPLRDRRADVPLEFVRVVERALEPDPASRYASVGAMEKALADTLHPGRWAWLRWVESHPGRVAAALVFFLVAMGVLTSKVDMPLPPPPPPPQPAPLTATVSLMRATGAGGEVSLPPGGTVKPGDGLTMRVTPSERMHVYVLNKDTNGEVYALFPIPGLVPTNPLEGHRTHRLPGSKPDGSGTVQWDVTSAGGQETIVVLGMREALHGIDSVLAQIPRAEWGRPAQIAPSVLQRLRGIGGLKAGPPVASEDDRQGVEALLDWLKMRREQKGDVWIWETVLKNPAPNP